MANVYNQGNALDMKAQYGRQRGHIHNLEVLLLHVVMMHECLSFVNQPLFNRVYLVLGYVCMPLKDTKHQVSCLGLKSY